MLKIKREGRFKLIIFGDGGVGKTSLTRKYLYNIFEEDTKMTIGAHFAVKYLEIDDKKIALRIWDFGGEERFRVLLPGYVQGAAGGIFMYDITRYSSLRKLDDWLIMFKRGLSTEQQIPIIMVGGKIDLKEKRSVKAEDAKELANSRNLQGYIECSSKTGENVEKLFDIISRKMMENVNMI